MKLTVTSLPTYDAYKDSDVPWIQKIPQHWELKTLKSVLMERNEKNDPIKTRNILSLCMYRGVIPYSEKGAGGNKAKEDLTAYKLAYPNDIVLNSMNVIAGSVGLSEYFGVVSPVYYMLRTRNLEDSIRFFNTIFQNEAFQKSLSGLGQGILIKKSESTGKLNTIRMKIPMLKLNRVLLPYPPPNEQIAIINLLDKKTDQIDKVITIKEQQIARLKEYQQITIQKAVTRGLNLNVAKKDTGIEWIGKIPKHWELFPMKRIAKLSPKIDLTIYKLDDLVTFLPMEKVSVDGEIICDIKQPIKVVNKGFTPFQKGDVIVAKITPCFENGKSALLNSLDTPIGFGSTEFYVLRPTKLIIDKFLYYIIKSPAFLKQGEGMMIGSAGQKRVPSSFISNFLVALPKTDEQKEIVNYIETESNKIEKAIELKQLQIEKLKEYKTTLINSAVTGKIKVV